MKVSRPWIVTAALILCAVGVLIFWQDTVPPTIAVQDGTALTLLKSSFGRSEHRLVHGTPWERAVYGWVPAGWIQSRSGGTNATLRDKFGSRAARHVSLMTTDTNTLVVWMLLQVTNRFDEMVVLPVDESGRPLAAQQGIVRLGAGGGSVVASTRPPLMPFSRITNTPPRETLFALDFSVFPRRERNVRLAVRDRDGKHLGEFIIPNPVYREYPRWNDSLVKTIGKVEGYDVELLRLWSGRGGSLDFLVRTNGDATLDLRLTGFEIQDATGNIWNGRHTSAAEFNFSQCVKPPPFIPTNETLRIRAHLVHTRGLAPSDVWIARDLPLPGTNVISLFTNTFKRGDVTLEFAGMRVPNLPPSQFNATPPFATAWFHGVSLPPDATNTYLTISEILDEHGRSIGASTYPVRLSGSMSFSMALSNYTGRATFIMAVSKPVTVEFMTPVTRILQ